MKKKFVLDTNVLLHDPTALDHFEDNDIYISRDVIKELDKFKVGSEEINVNAREITRRIETLTENGIDLEGIALDSGGRLFFLYPDASAKRSRKNGLEGKIDSTPDERIIQNALNLSKKYAGTVLVSKDTNMRIQARILSLQQSLKLTAEDYMHDKAAIDLNAFFKRDPEISVDKTIIDRLYSKSRTAPLPADQQHLFEDNQYYVLKSGSQSVLVRLQGDMFHCLRDPPSIEDIRPKNKSQRFLLDACLDEKTLIVSGLGKAGTGKTLLALAAGLHQVMNGDNKKYEQIIVLRPLKKGVRDIGYLPGVLQDKIGPHFAPIQTALEIILGKAGVNYEGLRDLVDYKPISIVQGDTFHNRYVLADEAQNFTPRELKLITTRMGENSKLVMVGDPFQVDNPYLDERSNGLTITTNKLRARAVPEFSYVVLETVERSRIAEIGAEYL